MFTRIPITQIVPFQVVTLSDDILPVIATWARAMMGVKDPKSRAEKYLKDPQGDAWMQP